MTTSRHIAAPARPGRNFFRSGELHLVLLALLADTPRHGYELMTELQSRFGDAYRPSPGSVYPALTALQAEGLVVAEDDGDRKVYGLSPTGRDALELRGVLLAAIEARTGSRLGAEGVEAVLAKFAATVRAAVAALGLGAVEPAVEEARARIERLADQGGERR